MNTKGDWQFRPMNPVYKAAWIAALRDPASQQATGYLAVVTGDTKAVEAAASRRDAAAADIIRANTSFCCKGLFCETLIRLGEDITRTYLPDDDDDTITGARIAYNTRGADTITGARDYGYNLPGSVVLAAGLTSRVRVNDELARYDDADIDPDSEYQIAYEQPDGTLSTLDQANDGVTADGGAGRMTFGQIAGIIEAQF